MKRLPLYNSAWYLLLFSLFVTSCGYHVIGSRSLPFQSITIRPVQNKTYEPGLEERLHSALSSEFINQGIGVNTSGSDVVLETTITMFQLGAIGVVDETVKEQELLMRADIKLVDNGKVMEFTNATSPIKITFQSTGTVSESAVQKESATDKACKEIAKEIVSKIILNYAK
jgi:hypothetical protein